MSFVGGDLLELNYKHPTLGAGTWFAKAAEDGTVDFGGYRSEDKEDGVTGDGQMIDSITRKRWSLEIAIAWDMTSVNELDQARKLASSPVLADWTISHISGAVFAGKGKPVGDLKGSSKDATTKIKLAGGGLLEQIS